MSSRCSSGLRTALVEPDATVRAHGMANALTGLDAAIGRTADSRALVGTRLARLGTESTRLDAGKLALQTDLSKTDSLDAASADRAAAAADDRAARRRN